MSQHDYNLANQAGASFRADLNSALLAIVSQNSAAAEPATMFAYQFWADTTTGILKQRNAANTAWLSLYSLAAREWLGSVATATNGVPVGSVIDFAGTAAPSGYLACPIVSGGVGLLARTGTYAALFAAIGITWGVGDGSTTFQMPWFATDYAAIQANANVGTSSVGQVIAHTHNYDRLADGSNAHAGPNGNAVHNTSKPATATTSTGGTANFAAGVRVLKCVKF